MYKILYVEEQFDVDIQLVDTDGKRSTTDTGDEIIHANVLTTDGTSRDIVSTNRGEGKYTVVFPGQQVGKYNLVISVDDVQIPGSPFVIDVMSGKYN